MAEVEVARDGPVATIALNRPDKKNALSIALRDLFSDALDDLRDDESTRCVIVTGRGDTFSAGFDLREFTVDEPGFQERLWVSSDRFHRGMLHFPVPVIAAVNGAALAGGLDLAVMCDLRIASETARFAHPERTFGDVVYAPLHDLVGGAVARELVLTGRVVSAGEARSIGLVNQVVPPDELIAAAEAMAADIAVVPRELLVRTKAKILARQNIPSATTTLDL
ncbi:MAG: enoyl-CoA hydratase/isomerase family protein [Frankiaceae bacterium]|nr:enoyl-CoA hydratase/isomerase family protein [Frankiaceae bacterium]